MNTQALKKVVAGVVVLWAGLAGELAIAHHSYAMFQMDKSVKLQGVVTKWEWTNPHTFLYVTVTKEDGSTAAMEFESVSPTMMARAGFSRNSFKVGDKITVQFHPHRVDAHLGAFENATFADGKVLSMGRPDRPAAAGAPAGAPAGAEAQRPAAGGAQ